MGAPDFIDELTPIAIYMAAEMNTNVAGPACRKLAALNGFSSQQCIDEFFHTPWWRRFVALSPQQCIEIEMTNGVAALLLWASKVMQGADWDHKPKLIRMFPTVTSGQWHAYGDTEYFHDIWSNIHYGFVGAAAGFSESVLLDGAGLEQIGSDIVSQQWPHSQGDVSGLRRFDTVSDRTAISTGIGLYRAFPQTLTAQSLLDKVRRVPGLTQRPSTRVTPQARPDKVRFR